MPDSSPEIMEVSIKRISNGFGLNIKGGKDRPEYATDDGIFVSKVTNSSLNEVIQKGDKLIEMNGRSLEGITHDEAVVMFSRAGQEIKLKLLRGLTENLEQHIARQIDKNGELSLLIQKELGMPITWTPRPEVPRYVLPRRSSREERELEYEADEYGTDTSDDSSEEEISEPEDEEEEEVQNENPEELFRKAAAENRIAHRTIDDQNLPSTVSLLCGKDGQKIYLIGTAHFSKESCEDVRTVINQTRPDVVVLELCRGRTDLLVNDEETLTKQAGEVTLSKIMTQIRHKGVISGVMTFLLLHMSAHITKQIGMAPGGEFRTAFREARSIPGCKVMFGDRSVEVTLKRAFGKLTWWQKIKFAFHVLKDMGPIKPEDIEKLKEKDMLEQALGEMMELFPEMTKVFLEERDVYLARSLQLAADNEVYTDNGKSPTVVVGVVGLGHASGVKENFKKEITLQQMQNLMETPKPSMFGKVFKICFRLTLLFGVSYGIWSVFSWAKPAILHLFSCGIKETAIDVAETAVNAIESAEHNETMTHREL